MSYPFALLIPGQLPLTEFQIVNDLFFCDIQQPQLLKQLSLFLVSPLPNDYAAALYYSTPPYENLIFIGAVANTRPSDIFNTGFALKPDVNQQSELKLIIKVEPIGQIQNQILESDHNDFQKNYAKLVAKNLFTFMFSYQKEGLFPGIQSDQYMILPVDFLDKWHHKFEQKYKMDPNFIYKTN